jgi:hypothetical protein
MFALLDVSIRLCSLIMMATNCSIKREKRRFPVRWLMIETAVNKNDSPALMSGKRDEYLGLENADKGETK